MNAVAPAATTLAQGRVWPANASLEERLTALRKHISEVEQRVIRLEQGVQRRFDELRATVGQLEETMHAEHARLRDQIEANTRESARIDARGLPVVGIGILLTAAPDQLASTLWIGWVILALGTLVTVGVATHALRHSRDRRRQGAGE